MNHPNLFRWITLLICASANLSSAADFNSTTAPVGRIEHGLETPVNQRVTPAGTLIELPGMRPQAIAMSPDGNLLVTAGLTHELLVLEPGTGKILQHVPLVSATTQDEAPVSSLILDPDEKAQLSFTGLIFSPDGSRIYLSNVGGDIKVFTVGKRRDVTALPSFTLPPANAPQRKQEIPAGLAMSRDGKRLYVAGNLSNRVFELDARSGKLLRTWNVGVAPYDVAIVGSKLYVSNRGGRRPDENSFTGPAGRGTVVRVDKRSIADEGSVVVIDLNRPDAEGESYEILTGPQAGALAVSPHGRYLVVANTGSDLLSVIDTRTDKVVEKICARPSPTDLFGAQPNALAFDKSGRTLYACNGTQNAVAVIQFDPGDSKWLGLVPVGWFPGAIAVDARNQTLCVANLKHIVAQPERAKLGKGSGFNTKEYAGSISIVPIPTKKQLAAHTQAALANLRYPLLEQSKLPARPGIPAQPVPERVGEPGVIKHVIYIIKENRTYDQVLGDVREGDGNADLCIFGEQVTPNQHKLVREFALLDNTYCSGVLSADGHQWADTALATDYVERSFAGWPRSYPSGGAEACKDALAYSSAGFIWDDALAHGKSFRNYGEFTTSLSHWKHPAHKGRPTFADYYRDFTNAARAIEFTAEPDLESLRQFSAGDWPSWDLDVPDVVRASKFIEELKQFEAQGEYPDFTVLWLPNDHTSGTKAGAPKPAAQVADNDLAFGQIVEAVSHSRFWSNTCIFAIEDDPQNGWDHVSGYRTTAYVVSPYAKRGAVIRTQYNQTSVLRTMELMLGLPPMNQMDATATPMFDCFTATPDLTPFSAVPNNVPLDAMNPEPKRVSDGALRKDAYASARLPLDKPDQCPEDVLNRILWRAAKGSDTPYPVRAVKIVDDD